MWREQNAARHRINDRHLPNFSGEHHAKIDHRFLPGYRCSGSSGCFRCRRHHHHHRHCDGTNLHHQRRHPNLAVTLPTVSASALASSGQTATPTPFTISLTARNPNSGNVRAFFETGPNVDVTTRRLKNNGTATNLQIGLLNTDNTPISIGAASGAQGTASVALSGGSANLTYLAQYVATGAVAAGTVTTSVTYSIEFP